MKKNITIAKRYINIPVSNYLSRTSVLIKNPKNQNILRYFDVSLGDEKYDFIAYYDMKKFVGQELEFEIENEQEFLKFFKYLTQSDSPIGLEKVYQERNRSQFHFSSKRGWLNDPNGLFYYNGKYHMFYQHNPFGLNWGNIHWGHAVSKDLLHWQEKGDILYPDEAGMMFSGGAVVDWKNTSGLQENEHPPIVLFYTAAGDTAPIQREYTQCIAYSVDGGETFEKYVNNPVVGFTTHEARDPKVVWDQNSQKWIMILYCGDQEKSFSLLTSRNLLDWEIIQELTVPIGRECPEFFPLPLDEDENNIKWIFMEANGRYFIGDFNGEKFKIEAGPFDSFGRMGEGCAYAGQIWSDAPNKRRTMICWQKGGCLSSKFNQTMTIPVDLSLKSFSEGIRLCAEPIKELENIKTVLGEFDNIEINRLEINRLSQTPGKLLKIPKGQTWDIEFELGKNCEVFVNICGEDIALDARSREVRMSAVKLPFPMEVKDLKVRIIVDHASIEIFGGMGRIWYAKRKITTCDFPILLSRHCCGAGCLKKVKIHKINSVWEPK